MNNSLEKIAFDLQLILNFNITDWHMYSVTYNSINGELNLYVDTSIIASKIIILNDRNVKVNFNEMFIGKSSNASFFFNGNIGEVRMYDNILGDSLIKEIYKKQNCFDIILSNSSNDLGGNNLITLIPNPATDKVLVSSLENISKVNIFSIDGKFIFTKNSNRNLKYIEINTNQLIDGIYIIQIITNSNYTYSKKLILSR